MGDTAVVPYILCVSEQQHNTITKLFSQEKIQTDVFISVPLQFRGIINSLLILTGSQTKKSAASLVNYTRENKDKTTQIPSKTLMVDGEIYTETSIYHHMYNVVKHVEDNHRQIDKKSSFGKKCRKATKVAQDEQLTECNTNTSLDSEVNTTCKSNIASNKIIKRSTAKGRNGLRFKGCNKNEKIKLLKTMKLDLDNKIIKHDLCNTVKSPKVTVVDNGNNLSENNLSKSSEEEHSDREETVKSPDISIDNGSTESTPVGVINNTIGKTTDYPVVNINNHAEIKCVTLHNNDVAKQEEVESLSHNHSSNVSEQTKNVLESSCDISDECEASSFRTNSRQLLINRDKQLSRPKTTSRWFKKCEICGHLYYSFKVYNRHILKKHSESATQYKTKHRLDPSVHTCKLCNKQIKGKYSFQRHMRDIHTDRVSAHSHQCDLCGDTMKFKGSLKQHILSIHTNTRDLQCDLCDKKFKVMAHLKLHRKHHNPDYIDTCTVCGKKVRKGHLTKHMRRHNGERDYECETCGKKFFERQDLRHHVRIHTGDKPHKCPYCPYTCAIKGNLNKHVKHKHEQDNYQHEQDNYQPLVCPQTGLNTMSYDPYGKRVNSYLPNVSHVIKRPDKLKNKTADNDITKSQSYQSSNSNQTEFYVQSNSTIITTNTSVIDRSTSSYNMSVSKVGSTEESDQVYPDSTQLYKDTVKGYTETNQDTVKGYTETNQYTVKGYTETNQDKVKGYTETNQFTIESKAKEHVEDYQRTCVSGEERYYTNLQRVSTEGTELGYHCNREGYHNSEAGPNDNSEGYQSSEVGPHASREGYQSSEVGPHASREGYQSSEVGPHASREGYQSSDVGPNASREGYQSSEVGPNASREGYQSSDVGPNASREGYQSIEVGPHASREGYQSSDVGPNASREGYQSSEVGPHASREGYQSSEAGPHASREGYQSSEVGPHASREGYQSSEVGPHASREGYQSSEVGPHASREGYQSSEVGSHASREGYHGYTIPQVTDMRYQYPSTPSYITATINLDDVPR